MQHSRLLHAALLADHAMWVVCYGRMVVLVAWWMCGFQDASRRILLLLLHVLSLADVALRLPYQCTASEWQWRAPKPGVEELRFWRAPGC